MHSATNTLAHSRTTSLCCDLFIISEAIDVYRSGLELQKFTLDAQRLRVGSLSLTLLVLASVTQRASQLSASCACNALAEVLIDPDKKKLFQEWSIDELEMYIVSHIFILVFLDTLFHKFSFKFDQVLNNSKQYNFF